MTNNNEVFKKIVSDINSECNEYSPRWHKVRELINYKAIFKNPLELAFDFDSRKFSWKYFASELLWYLSWDLISENISKYAKLRWDISDKNWMVNSNYWYIVFIRYIKWYNNQYNRVLESLKNDKDSRQAIIRYNDDKHAYKWNKDFVCTINNQFFIRNNKLHIIINMRSNDVFYWLQYDLVRFWLLLQSIRLDLLETYSDLELWNIYHNVWSIHYYEQMFDTASNIINEDWVNYKIILSNSLSNINKKVFNSDKYRKELETTKDYKLFIEKHFNIKIIKND